MGHEFDFTIAFKNLKFADKVQDDCIKFAVMIGHTKQQHDFGMLENMFRLLALDEKIRLVTICEQVNILKTHFLGWGIK